MTNIPPDIQAKRAIEDRALTLGNERRGFEAGLAANSHLIMDLLRDAEGSGVPLDHIAQLVGVSRQTLHRWRNEVSAKLQPGETAAQMLSKRTPEGHFLHYKG
jgi:hypothetical protein